MLLRPATPADAEGIARVEIAAWRHAYEEIVGPERLEYLEVEEHAAAWRARLLGTDGVGAPSPEDAGVESAGAAGSDGQGSADGVTTATVGEHDGRIVAVVAVRIPRPDPAAIGRLSALYVHPIAQGAGVGSSLLLAAEAELRSQAVATAELRVFAANWWARAFFAARGWTHDAGAPAGDDDPPTERWVRTLGERAAE